MRGLSMRALWMRALSMRGLSMRALWMRALSVRFRRAAR